MGLEREEMVKATEVEKVRKATEVEEVEEVKKDEKMAKRMEMATVDTTQVK